MGQPGSASWRWGRGSEMPFHARKTSNSELQARAHWPRPPRPGPLGHVRRLQQIPRFPRKVLPQPFLWPPCRPGAATPSPFSGWGQRAERETPGSSGVLVLRGRRCSVSGLSSARGRGPRVPAGADFGLVPCPPPRGRGWKRPPEGGLEFRVPGWWGRRAEDR